MNLFPFRTSSFVRTCLLAAMVLLSACLPEEAVRPGTPSGGDTQTLPTPAAAATPLPTYFAPFTGTPFHIPPDGEVVNGPPRVRWDLAREVEGRGGYLASFRAYTLGRVREGWRGGGKGPERTEAH